MIRLIKRHWRRRWERFYSSHRWHLVIDLTFVIIIIALVVGLLVLRSYQPRLSDSNTIPIINKPVVDLNSPPLEFTLSLLSVSPRLEDGLDLQLKFRNLGSQEISNIKVTLFSANNNFSVTQLTTPDNPAVKTVNRQLLVANISALATLETTATVYLRAKNSEAQTVNLLARLEYNLAGQGIEETITIKPWLLPAELSASGAAYYTSPQGDQLGLGPLPPVVGIPTNYWVFWEAHSRGDVKDLVISARLPKEVESTNNYALLAGNFTYSSSTRQIIWRVPDIKSQTDDYRLNFEIQLVPTPDQLGEVPLLVSNIRYRAVDSLTGRVLTGSLADLTADLSLDKFNEGHGQVVAE